MDSDKLLAALKDIAQVAGAEILSIYHDSTQPEVTLKADNSPLTDADRRAHTVICSRLQILDPETPVLSEESDDIDTQERLSWRRFWLIDPLDGTKEFINRNGEFTVNIALIEDGVPTLGVVHVPVTGHTYLGKQGEGAWKLDQDDNEISLHTRRVDGSDTMKVVASRRHGNEVVEDLIKRLVDKFSSVEVVNMGSSLKICLLAEGKADIYPRLAPTSEWDTAAAHAILVAAGGEIIDTHYQPLRYNSKADLLNPHFLALADPSYPWADLLPDFNDRTDG
jgi:3'(2'), 5'-bisphosphate nucleotidase